MDERLKALADYLEQNQLRLATAESCTAGLIGSILGGIPGCGKWLECGFISYSPEAKNRMLGVDYQTIETCGLTSEQVAREMAMGAIRHSNSNVAIANTGVAGPENAEDGTPAGTVCFAWAFSIAEPDNSQLITETSGQDVSNMGKGGFNQNTNSGQNTKNDDPGETAQLMVFTETKHFEHSQQEDNDNDPRNEVREQAAYYGLERIADYHRQLIQI